MSLQRASCAAVSAPLQANRIRPRRRSVRKPRAKAPNFAREAAPTSSLVMKPNSLSGISGSRAIRASARSRLMSGMPVAASAVKAGDATDDRDIARRGEVDRPHGCDQRQQLPALRGGCRRGIKNRVDVPAKNIAGVKIMRRLPRRRELPGDDRNLRIPARQLDDRQQHSLALQLKRRLPQKSDNALPPQPRNAHLPRLVKNEPAAGPLDDVVVAGTRDQHELWPGNPPLKSSKQRT